MNTYNQLNQLKSVNSQELVLAKQDSGQWGCLRSFRGTCFARRHFFHTSAPAKTSEVSTVALFTEGEPVENFSRDVTIVFRGTGFTLPTNYQSRRL